MEVTDVRIRKIHPQGSGGNESKMRAIVSVTFDNEFVVHDIKVIQGEQKNFIAMPSRKVEDGTYKDITHPIKSSLRNRIQDAVLTKYEAALAEMAAAETATAEAAAEETVEETTEETVEETTEETVEETAEETVEETAEETVEETAEEAVENVISRSDTDGENAEK